MTRWAGRPDRVAERLVSRALEGRAFTPGEFNVWLNVLAPLPVTLREWVLSELQKTIGPDGVQKIRAMLPPPWTPRPAAGRCRT